MNELTLKWYKSLKYFLLPLTIIFILYFFISVLLESFNLNSPFLLNILTDHLHINNVFRLGDKFWPVAIKILFLLLLLIIAISSEIGFIKKERYGRLSFYALLGLIFVAFIFDYIYFIYPHNIFASLSNINLNYLKELLMNKLYLDNFWASLFICVFWGIISTLLAFIIYDNALYFSKRKYLFNEEDEEEWQCKECNTINYGAYCKHCGKAKSLVEGEIEMAKEDIKLILPDSNKNDVNQDINLDLATKKDNLNKEDINLELNIADKQAKEDIEMHIDINPFANKIDDNISLELNPSLSESDKHIHCDRCHTLCDGLTYCPHCGKKL